MTASTVSPVYERDARQRAGRRASGLAFANDADPPPHCVDCTAVEIGARVPDAAFDGVVIAAFAPACYVEAGDVLLTVVTANVAPGPASVRLDPWSPADLRVLFRRGERVRCRDGRLHAPRAQIDLRRANVWRPARARAHLPPAELDARLRRAARQVDAAREGRVSVLARAAAPVVWRFIKACRHQDVGAAQAEMVQLVGWGEGLTPAGDDFIVGALAALHARSGHDLRRRAFAAALGRFAGAQRARTTPIAGHALALAGRGEFGADVLAVIDALLAEPDDAHAQATLARTLATGATSGADLLTGVLAVIDAWRLEGGGDNANACAGARAEDVR